MSDVEELLGLRPLAVEDRVRVRMSGECPLVGDPNFWHALLPAHGAEGQVLRVETSRNGHDYFVCIDLQGKHHALWFARTELERV